MKIGRLFIHMYHSGKDIAFANLLFHKSNRFAKKALTSAFFLPSKNSGLAVIRRSTKHGAVLAGFAVCRFRTPRGLIIVLAEYRFQPSCVPERESLKSAFETAS